jgi:hypothetical protein
LRTNLSHELSNSSKQKKKDASVIESLSLFSAAEKVQGDAAGQSGQWRRFCFEQRVFLLVAFLEREENERHRGVHVSTKESSKSRSRSEE